MPQGLDAERGVVCLAQLGIRLCLLLVGNLAWEIEAEINFGPIPVAMVGGSPAAFDIKDASPHEADQRVATRCRYQKQDEMDSGASQAILYRPESMRSIK